MPVGVHGIPCPFLFFLFFLPLYVDSVLLDVLQSSVHCFVFLPNSKFPNFATFFGTKQKIARQHSSFLRRPFFCSLYQQPSALNLENQKIRFFSIWEIGKVGTRRKRNNEQGLDSGMYGGVISARHMHGILANQYWRERSCGKQDMNMYMVVYT